MSLLSDEVTLPGGGDAPTPEAFCIDAITSEKTEIELGEDCPEGSSEY